MSYHSNSSATIKLLDQYGHGRAPQGDWAARPATLRVDDGDGHVDVWAYTGTAKDAALLISSVTEFRRADEPLLIIVEDGWVSAIMRDDWCEGVEIVEHDEDGEPHEWHYNASADPRGVCMQ